MTLFNTKEFTKIQKSLMCLNFNSNECSKFSTVTQINITLGWKLQNNSAFPLLKYQKDLHVWCYFYLSWTGRQTVISKISAFSLEKRLKIFTCPASFAQGKHFFPGAFLGKMRTLVTDRRTACTGLEFTHFPPFREK